MGTKSSQLKLAAITLMATAVMAACTPNGGSTSQTLGLTLNKETTTPGERWICADHTTDAWICPLTGGCITLTANLADGTGKIEFDQFAEDTSFHIDGIERRWDWALNPSLTYDYAFVIESNGRGKYYNFRRSADGSAKASSWFDCIKR